MFAGQGNSTTSYKYRRPINDDWDWYVGVSEGVTFLKTVTQQSYLGFTSVPSYVRSGDRFSGAFTYGADFGTEYKIRGGGKITLGVKLLGMESTNSTTSGVVSSVNLGYKFSF